MISDFILTFLVGVSCGLLCVWIALEIANHIRTRREEEEEVYTRLECAEQRIYELEKLNRRVDFDLFENAGGSFADSQKSQRY